MKSLLIWLAGILTGAALGYGLSFVVGLNVFLAVGVGVILGSSLGVTINIHRGRETDFPEQEIEVPEESGETEEKEPGQTSSKISQKAP